MLGKPVIAGTRLTVDDLLRDYPQLGKIKWDAAQIQDFPVYLAQIDRRPSPENALFSLHFAAFFG